MQASHSPDSNGEIVVKFVSKGGLLETADVWRRQLPADAPVWGKCHFIFDPDAHQYDWLVAYDDLPPDTSGSRPHTRRVEHLTCPREHTLLITAEPSSIKVYGSDFLGQFGHVLTSQEPWAIRHPPWAIRHPHAIFSQPALRWYYGVPYGDDHATLLSYETIKADSPLEKNRLISTVTSSKKMRYTLHHSRYRFIQSLKATIPDLEIFGHGVRPIVDKAEALNDFRYHVAIENHICRHHWTEKLSDAFLGCTLPFYSGAPNAADYFPAKSFIPIDINDIDGSINTIKTAINNGEYEKRLPYILEARQLILDKYNIFSELDRLIRKLHDPERSIQANQTIRSRHAVRRNLRGYSRYLLERTAMQWNRIHSRRKPQSVPKR